MNNNNLYSNKYKIIIIGDSGVGKSAFLDRYINNKFDNHYISTIGIDLFSKIININGENIKFHIWDSCGQENFKSLTRAYYRNVDAIIFMYSTSNLESFKKLDHWVNDFINHSVDYENTVKVVIGSKKDLGIIVPTDEAKIYAENLKSEFYEITSKNEDDLELINKIFFDIGVNLKKKPKKNIKNNIIKLEESQKCKSKCC
jgi:small GTP-binding protein